MKDKPAYAAHRAAVREIIDDFGNKLEKQLEERGANITDLVHPYKSHTHNAFLTDNEGRHVHVEWRVYYRRTVSEAEHRALYEKYNDATTDVYVENEKVESCEEITREIVCPTRNRN